MWGRFARNHCIDQDPFPPPSLVQSTAQASMAARFPFLRRSPLRVRRQNETAISNDSGKRGHFDELECVPEDDRDRLAPTSGAPAERNSACDLPRACDVAVYGPAVHAL